MVTVTIKKFCTCLELWKGCILAGIFAMTTSIFDLLTSIVRILVEEDRLVFYLEFCLGIESIFFIAASGILFVGLVKKSKFLLIPWMVLALIDVILNFILSFIELILPNRTLGAPCIIPIAYLAVTVMVCAVMLYCLLCVYAQYLIYTGKRGRITEIRVSPAKDGSSGGFNYKDVNDDKSLHEGNNVLTVPQISTPRDAW